MSTQVAQVVVYVLTGLAGLVVVLTRLRLGGAKVAAGRHHVGRRLVDVHTVAGLLALVLWIVFLVGHNATIGIVALALWWITVVAGLLILVRWLPTRGRHASSGPQDRWPAGPWLSILAHVGLLVGVAFFSWAYLTSTV